MKVFRGAFLSSNEGKVLRNDILVYLVFTVVYQESKSDTNYLPVLPYISFWISKLSSGTSICQHSKQHTQISHIMSVMCSSLKLRARWSFTAKKSHQFQLARRLDGPQSWGGGDDENSSPPRDKVPIVQHTSNQFTDWALSVHIVTVLALL
jgi:hypothetical protein